MTTGNTIEHVGDIAVDTARLVLVDPSYLEHVDPTKLYGMHAELNHMPGAALAITTGTGYGDGVYPVYIERSPDGYVVSLHVQFIEEDE